MSMPVMHDSDEWRDITRTVQGLSLDMVRVKGEVSSMQALVERSLSQQANQHRDNQKKIEDVDTLIRGSEDEPGLKGEMHAIKVTIRVSAWIIGTLLVAIGLWFASLESRRKLSESTSTTSTYSAQQ